MVTRPLHWIICANIVVLMLILLASSVTARDAVRVAGPIGQTDNAVGVGPMARVVPAAKDGPVIMPLVTPGALDPSFGNQGSVVFDLGGYGWYNALVVQPDGRIIAVGAESGGLCQTGLRSLVRRFNSDGSPDSSFTAARVLTPSGYWNALAIDEGKIVLVGGISDWGLEIVLRINADGSIDESFTTAAFPEELDLAAIAIQSDGKTVLGGSQHLSDQSIGDDFLVARLNRDGQFDSTFGLNGTVHSHFVGFDRVAAVALQPDGKIIAVGSAGNDTQIAVARYSSDGVLDTTFGTNGRVLFDWAQSEGAKQAAIQPDGKLIIAGDLDGAAFIARILPNGTLDPGFGSGGRIVTTLRRPLALYVLPNGHVQILGTYGGLFAIEQYTSSGELDISFGDVGMLRGVYGAEIVSRQTDGRYVTVYREGRKTNLTRYLVDGTLDGGFGEGGRAMQLLGRSHDVTPKVAIQTDGRIVVVGTAVTCQSNHEIPHSVVTRLLVDGKIDTAFKMPQLSLYQPAMIDADGNDRMLVVGSSYSHSGVIYDPAYARLLVDGDMVSQGTLVPSPPLYSWFGYGLDGTAQSDGGVVIAATKPTLGRFLADGSPDASFGTNGAVVDASAPNSALVTLPDNRVLIAGRGQDLLLTRYTGTGQRDTTFGANGQIVLDFGEADEGANDMALLPDGRILVAGTPTLVRLHSNGTIDTSFADNGAVRSFTADKLMLQKDGRIVVARRIDQPLGFRLARYLSSGAPDTSFGTNGEVVLDSAAFGSLDSTIDVALQEDSRAIIVGSKDGDIVAVRYFATSGILVTTPLAGVRPVIDGNIGDWGGLGATFLNTNNAAYRRGSQPDPTLADMSVDLWAAWAPEGLYFAGAMHDDVVIGNDSAKIWEDDSIELSVYNVAGDLLTHQFTLCADGRQADRGYLISSLTFVTRTVVGGWQFEVFIPATAMGKSELTLDQVFPFNFAAWDDDLGGGLEPQTQLVWQGTAAYEYEPTWGNLKLSGWLWNFPLQPTQTPTPTATSTATATAIATQTATATATSTPTPTPSATSTPSPTVTSIPSETPTPTATTTPTTGSLSGRVWLDSNGNGSPDPGEPGIFGVNVRLYAAGGMLGTIVTEGDGLYRFPPLTPGVYRVVEVQPAWLPFSSTPNDVTIQVTHGGMSVVEFGDWAGLSAWLPLILR